MSTKPKYLTKSRFKVGHECPTKLFYLDRKEYASNNQDNKFLKALADGGFQVGALAKIYFNGGIEVTETEHQKAVDATNILLKQENVTIFEAALMYENLFVRVDVLEKKGNAVKIIEVKAKSWNPETDSFYNSKNKIIPGWEPYIADIAFQRFVAQKAFPKYKYQTFLMLADKSKAATVDGLNQKFLLSSTKEGRTVVLTDETIKKENVGVPILVKVSTDTVIDDFVSQTFVGNRNFESYVKYLSDIAKTQRFVGSQISRDCGGCEYRVSRSDLEGKKSGFIECWSKATKLTEDQLWEPMIFDIWRLHYTKKERLLNDKRYFISELDESDIEPKEGESVMTSSQRQWEQVNRYINNIKDCYFDSDGFQSEMRSEKWKYPFHFIDFETITAAIPFNNGLKPYETIAFQFSHHTIDKNGKVCHQSQYINTTPGEFPNFEFVRELKKAIGNDEGTVFRYATHENTVLRHILAQLERSDVPDKNELIEFIKTLVVIKDGTKINHKGKRCMVDMLQLVLKYYYSPRMGGSNSIKVVLPAVLQESKFLKEQYGKPIYGSENGIKSHNFSGMTWYLTDSNGNVQEPYKILPPLFKDIDPEELAKIERIVQDDEIREGGAASTAYARMQFTQMSELERKELTKALLKYCELDTLAMVMIFQYWSQELLKKKQKVA